MLSRDTSRPKRDKMRDTETRTAVPWKKHYCASSAGQGLPAGSSWAA